MPRNDQQFLDYAKHVGADEYILGWVRNVLSKQETTTETAEHVIDFLVSDAAPKRASKMSFEEAARKAEEWTKRLQKKGAHIEEKPEDTETVLDFKDGFRIVKLVGKAAYEREGHLMRHCVGSYFGKDVEVYSLRDEKNVPHATMEKDQQVKGKGNGDIHPKYVDYVVKFLEHVGMTVGDSEMAHLGYINIEDVKDDLHDDITPKLYQGKYVRNDVPLLDKDGNPYYSLELLDRKPIVESTETSVRINVDLTAFLSGTLEILRKKIEKGAKKVRGKSKAAGAYSHLAAGADSRLAAGHRSHLAAGAYSHLAAGAYSHLAAGAYSHLAAGADSHLAAGAYSHLAAGADSRLAAGHRSHLAAGADSHLDLQGKNILSVAGHGSRAKGVIGSWFVIAEDDENGDIKNVCTAKVDGKKIKEDTWYEVKDGNIVEVKE